MKILQRVFVMIIFTVFFLRPIASYACGGFEIYSPVNDESHSTDNTKLFIKFKDNTETFVVQPDFIGDAKQFGVILPFPAKPEIEPVFEDFFQTIDDIIDPQTRSITYGTVPGTASSEARGVTVVESKNVGDFETTTLTATSAEDLISWLKKNNFTYSEADIENFSYYVEKKGYYFVALKVNLKTAKTDSRGMILGSLKPLQFEFTTDVPVVSMRISASDMNPMKYTLYTAGEEMFFVSGAQLEKSRKISKQDFTTKEPIAEYLEVGEWLTKSTITMNPKNITKDLIIDQAVKGEALSVPYVLNAENISKEAGIVLAAATRSKKIAVVEITPSPLPTATIQPSPQEEPQEMKMPIPKDTDNKTSVIFWTILLLGILVEGVFGYLLYKFLRKK